jgi:hypothetical protein
MVALIVIGMMDSLKPRVCEPVRRFEIAMQSPVALFAGATSALIHGR